MKDLSRLQKDLRELEKKLMRMPHAAGVAAVEFFTDNLANGVDVNGRAFTRRNPEFSNGRGRGILTLRGDLRRGIRLKRINGTQITITSDAPYTELHNEGGRVEITPKMRRFFWAKFYEATGKTRTKSGRQSRSQRAENARGDAVIWKNLALKKTPLIYPQRQFIGGGKRLDDVIRRALDDLLKQ